MVIYRNGNTKSALVVASLDLSGRSNLGRDEGSGLSIFGKMKKLGLNSQVRRAFQSHSRGFTLIEVLIALALFSIIAITFLGGLTTASMAVLTADVRATAESLAKTQMEDVKNPNQAYDPAPYGGVANYTKITGIPLSYTICSVDRDGVTVNCDDSDPIIAVPWDGERLDVDNGLQRIRLVVKHEGQVIFTLEGYKVNR